MESLTSLAFYLFFALSIIIYYIIPKRFQWIALLTYSIVFFFSFSKWWTFGYVLVTIISIYFCSLLIGKTNSPSDSKKNKQYTNKAGIYLFLGIIINLILLSILKYSNFFIKNWHYICRIIDKIAGANVLSSEDQLLQESSQLLSLAAPIGISFYTLMALGYLIDVYWGLIVPEKNVFKTALFILYYPLLTSGPIAKHDELCPQIYDSHNFEWKNLTYGLQRMLWGIFKKLVISARLAPIVNTIYSDTATYNGLYVWIAAAFFMLQLYTDFSGCMDIIIGASECYGIILPENFRTPFFSRSVQEFWQRWHISLGRFMKEYVMYPLMRSKIYKKLTRQIKAHLGKNASKQIPSYLAMLCVWLLIGLWHGGDYKYILGQGLWFFIIIVIEKAGAPFFSRLNNILKINPEAISFRVFQSVRTFILVMFGNIFFRAESVSKAFKAIKNAFSKWNPYILIDGELYNLGLDEKDFRIMIIGLIIILFVSILQEKDSIRNRLARTDTIARWTILLALYVIIIVFGQYGPGFDAAGFIYQGF